MSSPRPNPSDGDEKPSRVMRLRMAAALAGAAVALAATVLAVRLIMAPGQGVSVTVGGSVTGSDAIAHPTPFPIVSPLPPPTPPAVQSDHISGSPVAPFRVRAADQVGDGRSILVEEAVLGGAGWVVIHADAAGSPGRIIGVSSLLPPGTSRDVRISLTDPLTTGSYLFAMLHAEDNGDTTFDYPQADEPVRFADAMVDVRFYVNPA